MEVQNCVNAEGDTECRVAKWVDGHRQTYNEDLKDKWNKQHSWVGKRVAKMFDSAIYTGTITHWLPDSKTEWELWRVQYEDGDMEELDILENQLFPEFRLGYRLEAIFSKRIRIETTPRTQ